MRKVIDLRALLDRGGLISPSELAAALNISQSAVYAMVRRRTIPFLDLGKSRRFDPSDLKDWLQDRKVGIAKPKST